MEESLKDALKAAFISYAREDHEFVEELRAAFNKVGREIWVDTEDIPLTAKWRAQIRLGIERSRNIIFILTPAWLDSKACAEELEYAVRLNKRLIPILHQKVDFQKKASELRELQRLSFLETDDFSAQFKLLLKALDINLDWLNKQTYLTVRIQDWKNKEESVDLLLRGKELKLYEDWLTQSASFEAENQELHPSQVQREFIRISRVKENRRNKVVAAIVAVVLSVATLFGFVWDKTNRSHDLVQNANAQLQINPAISLAQAFKAVKTWDTAEAEAALRQAFMSSKAQKVLEQSEKPLSNVVFSPDGKLLVTTQGVTYDNNHPEAEKTDYLVQVWEVSSGRKLKEFKGHTSFITSVSFSPNGKLLVTTDLSQVSSVRLWMLDSDSLEGLPLRDAKNPSGSIKAVFSPDGTKIVTAHEDALVRVWDAKTGNLIKVLTGHQDWINDVAFSPDGNFILSASGSSEASSSNGDDTARLWEVAKNYTEVGKLIGHIGPINSAVFSPDGKWIATGSDDHTIRLWNATTYQQVAISTEHKEPITILAFSADSTLLASGSPDKTVRLWRVPDLTAAVNPLNHNAEVTTLSFSQDNQLVLTASLEGIARVWDVHSGLPLMELRGHTAAITGAVFSPDGKLIATSGEDKTVRLWQNNPGGRIATFQDGSGELITGEFSPDGKTVLTSSDDGKARLWEISSGKRLAVFAKNNMALTGAKFSPDGKLIVTSSKDQTGQIWEINSHQNRAPLSNHADWVLYATFSPNNELIVTTSGKLGSSSVSNDRTAQIWRVSDGMNLHVLAGHKDGVINAAFNSDSTRVVTAGKDNTARVWQVSTGKELVPALTHNAPVLNAKFSHGNQFIVTSSEDRTAKLWEASTGRELKKLEGHNGPVLNAIFSQDDRYLVTVSKDLVQIWELSTFEKRTLPGASSAAFSPDGRWLVTASDDKTANIWQTDNGERIATLKDFSEAVIDAAFSPNTGSNLILTISKDHTARIYSCEACLSSEALHQLVSNRLANGLTCQEQRVYLDDPPICSRS
jgi:WD40 repeat protein